MKKVYADYAATTPVYSEVSQEVGRILAQIWGNPSSEHEIGVLAKRELETARERIAAHLSCHSEQLCFTSGGSEGNTWAVTMGTQINPSRKKIVLSSIEHPSVINACKSMEKQGNTVEFVECAQDGTVSLSSLEKAIDENTSLVALMHANNETGVIQPIEKAAEIAHSKGALLFSDCVQTVGHMPVSFSDCKADIITFSGHKFGAPKGIGGICISENIDIPPLIYGGGQENSLRGGTENVAYAVGMAKALDISLSRDNTELLHKREALMSGLLQIAGSRMNGNKSLRLAGNVSMSFDGIVGQTAVMLLSLEGVYVSAASACSSYSQSPSHVLLAMGLCEDEALSTVRFTISHDTTKEDIDYIIEKCKKVICILRGAK